MRAAATERRRPAVPVYPLAAVPAATVVRVLSGLLLVRTEHGDVVHVLEDDGTLRCRTRATEHAVDDDGPRRMCAMCAAALGWPTLAPAWRPTREELAEVHLAAAERVRAAAAEQLAQIRSASIADGSALLRLEQVPAWRRANGVDDDTPVPPLRATFLVGQELTPVPVTVRATSGHMTDVLAAANARGKADRIDARTAIREHRAARPVPTCPHCAHRVLVATDRATGETVLVDPGLVDGGPVELLRMPAPLAGLVAVDHITSPAPKQPAHQLHHRTCPLWPAAEPVDLDDDVAEKSGGWRS